MYERPEPWLWWRRPWLGPELRPPRATENTANGEGRHRGNATDGVFKREWADYGARVIRSANYESMVYVVCQVNNGGWDGVHTQYGRPFTPWDRLSDGSYVYDGWIGTPTVAQDGYSPGMPACVFGP